MPLVKSLNELRHASFEDKAASANEIALKITFDILRESPQLVVDAETGAVGRRVLETAIIRNIDKNRYFLGMARDEAIARVFDHMFGYWDLEPYIHDQDISDIDATRHDFFTVKKFGRKMKIPVRFASEQHFESFLKLIAIRNGGILNENDSHCRVSDEKHRLRINVSIRPRNITGPALSIRKHRMKSYGLDDLTALGMMDSRMAEYLKSVAASGANVLVCGKGASGKTTLLRAIINLFPETERALVCETDTELYPDSPNFIVQRIKKANEGGRPVTLKDLVRDGLTMSLDTYVIGEIVGDEAWEFLKAGFTGHRVLATIHAGNAEDSFFRLLTLVKSANVDHSEATIKRMIAGSLDVVVFMKGFKVCSVMEVGGYDADRERILARTVFDAGAAGDEAAGDGKRKDK